MTINYSVGLASGLCHVPSTRAYHLNSQRGSLYELTTFQLRRKLVIVGDGACGKTSLLCCFALGEFPKEYRIRPLSYSKSHVILIAFSIDTPHSLDNVTVRWIEEVRSICGQAVQVLLVGFKADLRPSPGSPNSDQYVSREKAQCVAAEIGARAYKECSALKREGVDDVFEAATRASMLMREGTKHDRREPQEDEDKGSCCVIC
ncbi:P-loop containing nucleoside triphosphate hydrolase protein [Gautieria morchelliformis]|nr:P-loop containing nucleoside triphosphate hydrolase protein [Gautieria morchelliformis]